MPLPFDKRNPDLAAQIARAYGEQSVNNKTQQIGNASIGAMLDAQTLGTQPVEGPQRVEASHVQAELHKVFNSAREVFPSTISIPSLEYFRDELGHARLDRLIDKYTQLETSGKELDFVLAPVLTLSRWKDIYGALSDGHNKTAGHRLNDGGLEIDPHIEDSLGQIKANTADVVANSDDIPSILMPDGDQRWSLRIMPGTTWPDINDVRYTAFKYPEDYPTIDEYLSAQAYRLINNEPLLDYGGTTNANKIGGTWLYGTITDSSQSGAPISYAPCTLFDNTKGQIKIMLRETTFSASNLGVRRMRAGF